MTQSEKLERIALYRTAYELIATDGTQRVLVCYCESKSRQTIFKVARKHGEKLVKLCSSETIHFAKRSSDGATIGAWTIRFSGRTQREAIMEGELPFIGHMKL